MATATISSTNAVSGKLTSGASYTTQAPVGLDDQTLIPTLLANKVDITANAPSSGVSALGA